ncbi:class IV adenylate cyclase [Mesohalobacter halotolerans]|uniref:CYTH domain-containing protein n=1 Tax=Mesohalobacter halotolerans TaxID=1883405 RepID=A0A4U5TQV2_9FLAO|nr:class IV adenylate cyclase [Mesohalobacter halotolerans]MBS3738750.1 class IV adenylate cyclase [Psychroflexus sp.]TKS56443.1 CYTH domain-containing protein [Mesohalobacter halotolerans]
MNIKNYEFKAKVSDIKKYERKLLSLQPNYQGLDHQIDTYFNVKYGRLKLREGRIENALINYDRENLSGAKPSDVILYQHQPDPALKQILTKQFGVKVIVDKKRKIYFYKNIKFHFDIVKKLGAFIEVEAIDTNQKFSIQELKQQCHKYFNFFELSQSDTIEMSYSDLVLEKMT